MSWLGYFEYDGSEIINVSRTEAYAKSAGLHWFRPQFKNDALPYMLGDGLAYSSPFLDDAPWTDPDIAESHDFVGVYPLDVTGIEDSSRTSTPVESILDGGVPGRLRHGTKTLVFNCVLLATTDAGANYGMSWLKRALLGGACGPQQSSACNGGTLCYLSAAPDMHLPSEIAGRPLGTVAAGENWVDDPEECLTPYLRSLRRVVFNSGPTVSSRRELTDGSAVWTVTFSAVVGNPYELGAEVEVLRGLMDDSVVKPQTMKVLAEPEAVNYITNPSMESASGMVVLATNHVRNPSMAGTSGTVVVGTNLAKNPAVSALNNGGDAVWVALGGTLSLASDAPAEVVTGKSASLAYTAVSQRIEYQNVATAVGSKYTASVWIKQTAGHTFTFEAANSSDGSAVLISPTLTGTGAWVRHTLTFTAANTATMFKLRNQSAATGTLQATGLLVERADFASAYFDGSTAASGSYTYAWTGTAHASTSTKTAPALADWSTQDDAPQLPSVRLHQSTTWGWSGSSSAYVLCSGDRVYQGIKYSSVFTPTSGLTYTASAYVYAEAAMTMRVQISGGQTTGTASVSIPATTWTRVSHTWASNATAAVNVHIDTGAIAQRRNFYVDAVQIEQAGIATTYFDGATPAAGDFTHAWTGTANASTSRREAPRLARWETNTLDSVMVANRSTERAWSGAYSARVYAKQTFSGGLGDWAGGNPNVAAAPGETWSFSAYVYNAQSVSRTAQALIRWRRTDTSQVSQVAGALTTLAPNAWTRIVGTATAPAETAFMHAQVNLNGATAGDTYYVDAAQGERALKPTVYFDGSTAGADWDGARHASVSRKAAVYRNITIEPEEPTTPWVGGEPPGGGIDLDGYVHPEPECEETEYLPLYDPENPNIILPPEPPSVPLGNWSKPKNWRRRTVRIPKQYIPLWGEVVPKFEVHAKKGALRSLRLRFYADPYGDADADDDACDFCTDLVISYVPQDHTLVIDGAEQVVYVVAPGGGRRRADALVFATNGKPFEWPALTCGFGYLMTVDLPQTQKTPSLDLSLFPRAV